MWSILRWTFVSSLLVATKAYPARAPTLPADQSLADAVERVVAGVVNIKTHDLDPQSTPSERQLDDYFRFFLAPGGGGVELPRSQGSGFFYNSKEFIVTNYHVVKDAKDLSVTLSQSALSIPARLVGYDAPTDIAILQVKSQAGGTALRFGSSPKLRLGESVFAIGNPFGFGHSVSAGIISAKNRSIGAGPYNDFLQTDTALNPGNSGGPLFNIRGEVVGINTAIARQAVGISFAIPSEIAKPIVEALIQKGRFGRGQLGIFASTISDGTTQNQGFGVFIERVVPKGAAERAKLQAGDIILSADGTRTQDLSALRQIVAKKEPGDAIVLKLFRKAKREPTTITLTLTPPNETGELPGTGF
jgi:serine protease Do